MARAPGDARFKHATQAKPSGRNKHDTEERNAMETQGMVAKTKKRVNRMLRKAKELVGMKAPAEPGSTTTHIKDAINRAADKANDAVDGASDAASDGMDKAKSALKQAGKKVKEAGQKLEDQGG